jgi:hypothetical protein
MTARYKRLAVALALALAACASPPPHAFKTDREREELKGPVKSVLVEFEGARDRYGQIDRHTIGTSNYDEAGALTADEDYTPDFIKKRKAERIGADVVVFHSVMGDSTEHYVFDATGNTLEEDVHFGTKPSGAPDPIIRHKYDAQGREIERDFSGPSGKIGGAFLYTRDADGNIAAEEDWLNDPKLPHARMRYSYDFDMRGNWIRRREIREPLSGDYPYGPVGTLIRTITYYGDDAGGSARPVSR